MTAHSTDDEYEIPSGWAWVPLGSIAAFRTGPFGTALHRSDYVVGGVPIINPMHISGGRLNPGKSDTVTEATRSRLIEYELAEGDIVLGRRGEMGRCAAVTAVEAGWLCGSGSFVVRPRPGIDPNFLQMIISSPRSVRWLTNASIGSTMNNLNHSALAGLPIPLPARTEQRAIANAVLDADAAVAGLDALIAKKREVQQSLRHSLVTGVTRLAGFNLQWADRPLASLGEFSKGEGISRADVRQSGLPCVTYGELYTRHHHWIRRFYSHVEPAVARRARRLNKGDLLFAGSGETAAEIGKCVAFVGDEQAYAGGDVIILRPREASSLFLGYALNSQPVVAQRMRLAQGDAVVHISARALGTIEVRLPERAEQDAIASTLAEVDEDLDALIARRQKTAMVRQAMAHDLLTGRTRLT